MPPSSFSRSPLAPERFPELPEVPGARVAGMASGLKRSGAHDLFFAELQPGSTVAAVLTRSLTCSAPVDWCRASLAKGGGAVRGIVVNSGNANAFTGEAGSRTVERTVAAASELLGCSPYEVYVASTGVIGEPVPADHIPKALPGLRDRLDPTSWPDAAAGIMTTDTFPKGAVRKARIGDAEATIVGIAKGSGMIAPDMATMLGFVFTDAKLPADALQWVLARGADRSFNCITVDGDTSTSDTVVLCATGALAGQPEITDPRDRRLGAFRRALDAVLMDLAQQIVRDGEGASKFVTITVSGAASSRAARRIGLAIGNSPLVKTAIAGQDPNWGRVVMAVGKSGERASRDKLVVSIGGVPIAEDGQVRGDYDEGPVAEHMRGQNIDIAVDVGIGRGKATVWTCDLTHRYIDINADYRS